MRGLRRARGARGGRRPPRLAARTAARCPMKRTYRLRRPEQFQRVRRDGRRWSDELLTLNAAPSRRRTSRCGFVVGKRIGTAVTRNRARRRVREAVRLVYDQIAPGWDLVFVIRSPALATIDFPRIQSLVVQLLQRAGAWRETSPAAP